jgi:hypothetical protein
MTDNVVSAIGPYKGNQAAGSKRLYEIDLSSQVVEAWQANIFIAPSALIRPTQPNQNGYVYQNGSQQGQTGALEPAWPNPAAQTVQDGSVTWTALTPVNAGEDQIQSVVWSQVAPPDPLLTISAQANSEVIASALIGGGTSGNIYTVLATVTMVSGAVYPIQIIITVL